MAATLRRHILLLAVAAILLAGFFTIYTLSPLAAFAKNKGKDKKIAAQQAAANSYKASLLYANITLAADGIESANPTNFAQDDTQAKNTIPEPASATAQPVLQTPQQAPEQAVAPAQQDPVPAPAANPTPEPSNAVSPAVPAQANPTTDSTAQTPPPSAKVAFTTQPDPAIISGQQAQEAITTLSQGLQRELWSPSAAQSPIYATDAYSPETTRALTVAAFLLIFSGLILRRLSARPQPEPRFAFEQQKLSFVK
jgi:outer membrane biosynthesis protein TonB